MAIISTNLTKIGQNVEDIQTKIGTTESDIIPEGATITEVIEETKTILTERAVIVIEGDYASLEDFVSATDTNDEKANADSKFVKFNDTAGWGPLGTTDTWYKGFVIYQNYYGDDITDSVDGSLMLYTSGNITYNGYISGNKADGLSVEWSEVAKKNDLSNRGRYTGDLNGVPFIESGKTFIYDCRYGSCTNLPCNNHGTLKNTYFDSASYAIQEFVSINGNMYIRQKTNNTWLEWITMISNNGIIMGSMGYNDTNAAYRESQYKDLSKYEITGSDTIAEIIPKLPAGSYTIISNNATSYTNTEAVYHLSLPINNGTIPAGIVCIKKDLSSRAALSFDTVSINKRYRAVYTNDTLSDWVEEATVTDLNNRILTYKNITVTTTDWKTTGRTDGYNYYADIACEGVTTNHVPNVVFYLAQVDTGNFGSTSSTDKDGYVTLYAKEIPSADFIIPTIQCIKA